MSRNLGWVCLFTYGLAILGAANAPEPSREQDSASSISSKPVSWQPTSGGVDLPLRGFALNLHHTDQLALYLQAIDEMAALGFNSVEILTPAFQTNGASDQIQVVAGPARGPERQQLVTLLRHAQSRGLMTCLMPVVLFTEPRGNEWRGKIHPEKWDPWWQSYSRMIDHFLSIANETGVDVFCVGSELLSTEKQVDRWISLIRHARQRFNGKLTYSTNWDHYHVPTLWQHLDIIGISGYWDITTLTDPAHPNLGAVIQRWRQIREKVLAFGHAQARPVMFTEIGYPSLPWGLKDPWNYTNPKGLPADHNTQAKGYQAFLEVWEDLLIYSSDRKSLGGHQNQGQPATTNPLAGVFFYAWDPYHAGGPDDTGYGVRGKPAMELLRARFTP